MTYESRVVPYDFEVGDIVEYDIGWYKEVKLRLVWITWISQPIVYPPTGEIYIRWKGVGLYYNPTGEMPIIHNIIHVA
jgi:hypothetical protein